MGFDVMREPWIGCLGLDGEKRCLSIWELLLHAQELQEVVDISPLQEYGIYRLLTVLVMDMCRPQGKSDLEELLDAGHFEEAQLSAYVAECEKEGPCFDLFDPIHPFLQDAYEERYDKGKVRPVSRLFYELPSGGTHMHFTHQREDAHVFTYAQCARMLCAVQVFSTAGTHLLSGINGAPPYYVLIRGENLYQTLILNCIPKTSETVKEYEKPGPAYRNTLACTPNQKVAQVSLLEGMTLRPKRICLIDEGNGQVRQTYLQEGCDFVGYGTWRDPHTLVNPETKSSIKPSLDKDTWRNVSLLFGGKETAPLTVRGNQDILPTELLQINLYGVVTNQASYKAWMKDTLVLPKEIILDPCKSEEAYGYVAFAESVGACLKKVVANLAKVNRMTQTSNSRGSNVITRTMQRYYAQVRDGLFTRQLPDLANAQDDGLEELQRSWMCNLKEVASHALNWGSAQMGNTAKKLANGAQAELSLYKQLNKLLKKEET